MKWMLAFSLVAAERTMQQASGDVSNRIKLLYDPIFAYGHCDERGQ
jgi:hypothetical protein